MPEEKDFWLDWDELEKTASEEQFKKEFDEGIKRIKRGKNTE